VQELSLHLFRQSLRFGGIDRRRGELGCEGGWCDYQGTQKQYPWPKTVAHEEFHSVL
jgi:hypothetical protein